MRQKVRKTLLAVAFLLFQIRLLHLFFSPVLPIAAARKGIASATLITYGTLCLSSLFLGRAFCGWFCPGAATNELVSLVIKKPAKGGWRNWIKYWISGMWTIALIAAIVSAGGLSRIDPFYGTDAGTGPPKFIIRFGAYILIIPLALLFGRWASCHYMCWIAPFLVLGSRLQRFFRWPALQLRITPEACLSCESCRGTCPMSLDVPAMTATGSLRNDECILCGNCADHCPSDAIHFSFSR